MSAQLGRKFDRDQVLVEKFTWNVAARAIDITLEFAVLGYIDIATELFTLFRDYASNSRGVWSPGLYFAWDASGQWPDCIPAEERTEEYLKKREIERILWKRETNGSEEGLEKLLKAAKGGATVWDEERLNPDDLAAALDLALFLGKKEKAQEVLEVFAENMHWTISNVSKSRLGWGLMKEKAMSKILGLDDKKVRAFGKEVLGTFRERMKNGPIRRPFEHLSMKELVELCSENTLKNADWEDMDYDDPDDPPKTLLRDPATAEDIAALEKKLGRTDLPDDYKEFLQITNGLSSRWNGFFGEPPLSRADEVIFVDATEDQQMWEGAAVDLLHFPNSKEVIDWPPFEQVIQINNTQDDSERVWLITPEILDAMRSNFFEAFQKTDDAMKKIVEEVLESAYGGTEAAMKITWLVCTWDPKGVELNCFVNFREFLEYAAGETARDELHDEEDEEGRPLYSHDCFAYGLR